MPNTLIDLCLSIDQEIDTEIVWEEEQEEQEELDLLETFH